MPGVVSSGRTIQIRVVSTEGCVNTPPTIERLRDTAAAMGVKITLEEVLVATQEDANAHRFFGSPTVQINGLDLDPAMRDETRYGFT